MPANVSAVFVPGMGNALDSVNRPASDWIVAAPPSVIAPEFTRRLPVAEFVPKAELIVSTSSAPVPCHWKFEPACAKVTGVASGKVMDVSGVSTANGANIHLWDWLNATNQKWTVTPVGDGYVRVTAVHSGKVADVEGPSTANGADVHQWDYVGALNQYWRMSSAP